MLLLTTETIPGRQYEALGMVEGSIVQTKNFGKDLGAGFKSFVGGELKSYTQMLNEARGQATDRMVQKAEALGADAVIGVRYSSAAIMQGSAEVLAFGTAVRFLD